MGILGILAEDAGDFDRAYPLQLEAMKLSRALGDRSNAALSLTHVGVIQWGQGREDDAIASWQEALATQRELGEAWGASISLSYLGLAACNRSRFGEAADFLAESLAMRWAMRTQEEIAHGIANFGVLAAVSGQHAVASRLLGAAEALREAIGLELQEPERSVYARATDAARGGLHVDVFTACWSAGRALPPAQAVAEALATRGDHAEPPGARPPVLGTASLTSREHEVLRLLVLGRTDREIAAALFVSPRTVHGHVANIFSKLGVNTRTAAVTTAIAAGILPAPA
jgi:DNA-binding CsgD family transcriptional regulator